MELVSGASAPEVPVTVTAVGPPRVAELLAVTVKVLVVVAGLGLNDAVTPVGSVDVTANCTLPVNPLVAFTVIVLVLLPPSARFKEVGLADRVKFGGGVTVRLIVVV